VTSSRAYKKRQLAGTETDIMHQMLYASAKPPVPSPQRLSTPADLTETKQTRVERRNAVDLVPPDAKTEERRSESDNESNASADTYTIDSDGKDELRQERARIDVVFGVAPDNPSDERHRPLTDTGDTHLLNDDDDDAVNNDDCSLQIHEDSDDPDQPPLLRRSRNQTLFPKYTEQSASSVLVGKSEITVDLEESENASHNPNNTYELDAIDGDISVALDQDAEHIELTNSRNIVKSHHSKTDDVAVHDVARQNSVSDAAGSISTVHTADTECEEPMLKKSTKSDATCTFGNDDDDDDGSQPAAVSLLNSTENYYEVHATNLF